MIKLAKLDAIGGGYQGVVLDSLFYDSSLFLAAWSQEQ